LKILLLILIVGFSVVFVQSTFAYHEERERIEISHMTGIFSENMKIVIYPIIDKQYHVQVVLREDNQPENATMNVGYRFNLVEKTPHRYSLDESPQETKMNTKARHILQSGDSKTIQTGQYDFPIIVNFTATFEKPGFYNFNYFESQVNGGGHGSNSGLHHVVSKYSKAIDDDGACKNTELSPLTKHDFSTLICVTPVTRHDLITQGWAPRPD
jgi:hypothetical protein